LELLLAVKLVTLSTIKSFIANSALLAVLYSSISNTLQQPYLYDLAMEYKSNFDPSGEYTSSNCSVVLQELER